MYTIGNIIFGSPMPWDPNETHEVAAAHLDDPATMADWLKRYNEALVDTPPLDETDLIASIRQCDLGDELFDWLEDLGWTFRYHGGAAVKPGWFGVELGTIDETDHVAITDIPTATPEQVAEVTAKHAALPEAVRALIPAPGHFIVWSSS